jgi:hypothetical protein
VPRERLVCKVTGPGLEGLVAAARLLVVAMAVPEMRRVAPAAPVVAVPVAVAADDDAGVAAAAVVALALRADASEARDARIACSAASPSRKDRSTKDCEDDRREPEVRVVALPPARYVCGDGDGVARERALRGVEPAGDAATVGNAPLPGDAAAEDGTVAGDIAARDGPVAGDAATCLVGDVLGVVKPVPGPDPPRAWLQRSALVAAVAAAWADAATAAKASDARVLDWLAEVVAAAVAAATATASALEGRARDPVSPPLSCRHSPTVELRLRVGDAWLRVGEWDPRGSVTPRSWGEALCTLGDGGGGDGGGGSRS